MKIEPPLKKATLLRRYKRFLADMRLADGAVLTAHCPNTGSMKNCVVPGTVCWYSESLNPRRKLPATLEITTTPSGAFAGVNTGRPNSLVEEAIRRGLVKQLQGYHSIRREVPYGSEKSRIDLLLENVGSSCYVEVKNVTLESVGAVLLFPDAVTSRGAKHLRELMAVRQQGHRAVLFFCVQHSAARMVAPAWEIDPLYCETLALAKAAGVEVLAYRCELTPDEIALAEEIPFSMGKDWSFFMGEGH